MLLERLMQIKGAPPVRRLIDNAEFLSLVPLSYVTLWQKMRRGEFPQSVKLDDAGTRVAWFADEIESWIESRERVHLKPPPAPAIEVA